MTINERWIKRHIHGVPQNLSVRCARGIRSIVLEEALAIRGSAVLFGKFEAKVTESPLGVAVSDADFRHMLEYPLRLRTARDVFWQFFSTKGGSLAALRKGLCDAPWNAVFPASDKIAIKVTSLRSRIFHEGRLRDEVAAALLRARLAVAQNRDEGTQLLEARLEEDRLNLAVSLAGFPLYHRGYRHLPAAEAPMSEDLAAAATLLALQFSRQHLSTPRFSAIFAPFAGSGTLGFEAWSILSGLSPAKTLPQLACERFPCAPAETIHHLKSRLATGAEARAPTVRFVELDAEIAQKLRLGRVDLPAQYTVDHGDALQPVFWRFEEPTFIAANPPYGIRLSSKRAVSELFKGLANRISELSSASAETAGYAFVPKGEVDDFARRLSRIPTTRVNVLHGGLTVSIVAFAAPHAT